MSDLPPFPPPMTFGELDFGGSPGAQTPPFSAVRTAAPYDLIDDLPGYVHNRKGWVTTRAKGGAVFYSQEIPWTLGASVPDIERGHYFEVDDSRVITQSFWGQNSDYYFQTLVNTSESSIWGYYNGGDSNFKSIANATKASIEAWKDPRYIIASTEDLTDTQPIAKFREVIGGDMMKRYFLCTEPDPTTLTCEDLGDPLVRNIYAQYIGSHPPTGPCEGSETYVDFAQSFIQVATDSDPLTRVTVEPGQIWVSDIDQSLSVESHAINITSSAGASEFSDTYLHVSRNTGAYASFDGEGWLELRNANGDESYLGDRLTISSGNFSGSSELWPGTLKIYGDSSSSSIILEHASTSAEINMNSSIGSVGIRTADLTGTNTFAKFRQVKVCVDGQDKKAWVLMTEPEPL